MGKYIKSKANRSQIHIRGKISINSISKLLDLKLVIPRTKNKEVVLKLEKQGKSLLEARSPLPDSVKPRILSLGIDVLESIRYLFERPEVHNAGVEAIRTEVMSWSVELVSEREMIFNIKDTSKEQVVKLTVLED